MAVAAAQQPVPQALLPQQALEIAAQAAEQVQNARGAAQPRSPPPAAPPPCWSTR